MESWEDVEGYEGIYQVSSLGYVKRVAAGQGAQAGHILKPRRRRNGYLQVGLWRDGKRKNAKVHRLVLRAFIGDAPSPKHQGNHRNGNRADNRIENLEWATCSENHKHAYRTLGREAVRGEAHCQSKLTEESVKEIRKLYATGEWTQVELGRMFGVDNATISRIVRYEMWGHVP